MADEPELPTAETAAGPAGEDTAAWGEEGDGGSERILNQDEIDSLLGFEVRVGVLRFVSHQLTSISSMSTALARDGAITRFTRRRISVRSW